VRLTGIYKNMARGIVALVFRSEHDGSEPEVTDEVAETRWMSREEIAHNLDPAYACRLLDALAEEEPAIRSHDGMNLLGKDGP
jgi:NADH pyrophosphatase NudC (nudix superfamily)